MLQYHTFGERWPPVPLWACPGRYGHCNVTEHADPIPAAAPLGCLGFLREESHLSLQYSQRTFPLC